MNKILITGGLGLIGFNLIQKLNELYPNTTIYIVDNCLTQKNIDICYQLIKKLNNPNNIFYLQKSDSDLEKLIKNEIYDIDTFFELKAPASPEYFEKNPIYTSHIISYQFEYILDKLTEHNYLKTVFLASTSEVYGKIINEKYLPLKEDAPLFLNTLSNRASYATAKIHAENILYTYANKYGINYKIGRIFNTYGIPIFDDGRFIQNLIKAIKTGEMILYGKNIHRSFCYVKDLVNQIIGFVNSDYNGIINLGGEDYFSLEEVVEMMSSIVGKPIKIKYDLSKYRKDETIFRRPNLKKMKNIIGYENQYNLYEGLCEIIHNQDVIFFKEK